MRVIYRFRCDLHCVDAGNPSSCPWQPCRFPGSLWLDFSGFVRPIQESCFSFRPTRTHFAIEWWLYLVWDTPKKGFAWNLTILVGVGCISWARSDDAAAKIYAEGRGFLRAFKTLGYISIRLKKPTFFMKPKFHVPEFCFIMFSINCFSVFHVINYVIVIWFGVISWFTA